MNLRTSAVIGLVIMLTFSFCGGNRPLQSTSLELEQLTEWMTGSFSSAAQAAQDSAFFSINLEMNPIWPQHTDAMYLYVEQAVSTKLEAPYRQRVYRITQLTQSEYSSEVFELPNAQRFIQKGNTPEVFDALTPDSLVVREGCAVYLSKVSGKEFSGSTRADQCKSSLYGAAYATSKVQVFKDKIISWDQGWDDSGEQVWGAEKGGYIFDRISD